MSGPVGTVRATAGDGPAGPATFSVSMLAADPADPAGTVTLAEHWDELASVALLGTNRRPIAPLAPAGLLGALQHDAAQPDPASDVLVQVAALNAARRAGVRPGPSAPRLVSCPCDPRVECPAAAIEQLSELLQQWPELIDEWLSGVAQRNWRLGADSAVALLQRFRSDPIRRPVIVALVGPLADWLGELFPNLQPPAPRRVPPAPTTAALDAMTPLELAELRTIDDPGHHARALAQMISKGTLAARHRSALIAHIKQLRPTFLAPLTEALGRAGTNPNTMGLALAMADLAAFRHSLFTDLSAAHDRPTVHEFSAAHLASTDPQETNP